MLLASDQILWKLFFRLLCGAARLRGVRERVVGHAHVQPNQWQLAISHTSIYHKGSKDRKSEDTAARSR